MAESSKIPCICSTAFGVGPDKCPASEHHAVKEVSEPTQESLERARKLALKTGAVQPWHAENCPGCRSNLNEIALAFDAIRAEEQAKAEKLAEALRWLAEWQHEGKDPGHCNRKIEDCPHHACRRTVVALRLREGAQHG